MSSGPPALYQCTGGGQTTSATDIDGNTIQLIGTANTHIVDTLGRTVISPGGTAPCGGSLINFAAPNGNTDQVQLCYSNATLQTNFGVPNVYEAQPTTVSLLNKVILPNNTTLQLTYDQYGSITSIQLPTGDSISYTWQTVALCPSATDHTTVSRAVKTRTLVGSDLTSGTWTYNFGAQQSDGTFNNVVTTPAGDDTLHVISQIGAPCSLYETKTVNYQGSQSANTPLKAVVYGYNQAPVPPSPYQEGSNAPNVFRTSVTTTWANGQTSQIVKTPDTGIPSANNGPAILLGNVVNLKEYDYGSNAPGTLIRQTSTSYAWQTGSNSIPGSTYLAANIIDAPTSVAIQDASGNRCSETDFTYDEANYLTASNLGSTYNHNAAPNSVRGHVTTTARQLGVLVPSATACNLQSGSSWSSGNTHTNWYDTGEPYQSIDAMGNRTAYSYSTTYWGAYITQTADALQHTVGGSYDFNTGLLTSYTDENNQTTGYSYDNMFRPTGGTYPDGGAMSLSYSDNPANGIFIARTRLQTAGNWVGVDTTWFDGLGRNHGKISLDPEGYDYSGAAYDSMGRLAYNYDPAKLGVAQGTTHTQYDPLGRVSNITKQDGSIVQTSYSGSCATVTDEAGKQKKSCSDALGRVTRVWEDPSGLNYETDYSYDILGNLIKVAQNGSDSTKARIRTFTYDSLSRLITSANPESGAVCNGIWSNNSCVNGYDANGNLLKKTAPAPNQTGTATVTTTYTYDALNRVTQKSYSDGITPSVYFMYDSPSQWGLPISNVVGRLSEVYNFPGPGGSMAATVFSYDPMGRIILNTQAIPGSGASVTYNYDLMGDMTNYTTGVASFGQSFDTLGRVTQLTSNVSDANHPGTLATVDSGIGYYASGQLRKVTYGNGLTETNAYNARFQPCHVNVNSSGSSLSQCSDSISTGNVQDFNYGFNSGSSDNGNLAAFSASGAQSFSRSYGYDALNRLQSMSAPGDSCSGLSWSYDAWGNRTAQAATGGSCYSFNAAVNTNNQLSGAPYQYDAAGNLMNDGYHSYTYDAEGRLLKVDSGNAASYTYDGLSRRVRKDVGTLWTDYVYDLSGNVVTEFNNVCGNPCWTTSYIYLGGHLMAEYARGTTYFIHRDQIESTRLLTAMNGSVYDKMDYLPYGEKIAGGSGSTHEFTSDEFDSESGLYHAQFRQYADVAARWMTPDPAGNQIANVSNPQSWNMYGYVNNNPLNFLDPLGLCGESEHGGANVNSYDSNTNTADTTVNVTEGAPCIPVDAWGWAGMADSNGGPLTPGNIPQKQLILLKLFRQDHATTACQAAVAHLRQLESEAEDTFLDWAKDYVKTAIKVYPTAAVVGCVKGSGFGLLGALFGPEAALEGAEKGCETGALESVTEAGIIFNSYEVPALYAQGGTSLALIRRAEAEVEKACSSGN